MSLFFVDVNPQYILSRSESEDYFLQKGSVNFASWYRHISQENVNAIFELTRSLQEVIDGFDSLSLNAAGENVRILKAHFNTDLNGKPQHFDFAFEELSDGQRTLVVLYTVLNYVKQTGLTLCMDEPANFVSLAEIQPYLMNLRDIVSEGKSQAILISHHPEVINYFASDNAVQFSRSNNGPIRSGPFEVDGGGGLLPAEIVARGWNSGQ